MSFAEKEIKVVRWAEDRGIVKHGTHIGQARKTLEECGELIEAIGALNALKRLEQPYSDVAWSNAVAYEAWRVRDAVGDILVTLIVGCAVADIDLTECLEEAYQQIKDRKGHLRADGVFVKSE